MMKLKLCFYIFYNNYIEKWFNNNKNKCPIYKNNITNEDNLGN